MTCVRAAFSGELGQRDGIIGVIGAGAGDDGTRWFTYSQHQARNLAVLLVVQAEASPVVPQTMIASV